MNDNALDQDFDICDDAYFPIFPQIEDYAPEHYPDFLEAVKQHYIFTISHCEDCLDHFRGLHAEMSANEDAFLEKVKHNPEMLMFGVQKNIDKFTKLRNRHGDLLDALIIYLEKIKADQQENLKILESFINAVQEEKEVVT